MAAILKTADLSGLPGELAFQVRPHWLARGEPPFVPTSPDEPGYGWSAGQPGGFAVFGPVSPPVASVPPVLERFPRGPTLIGDRLFHRDLLSLLASRFGDLAGAAALTAIEDGVPDCCTMQQIIASACVVSPLILLAESAPIAQNVDESSGRRRLSVTLPYTGSEWLWSARVAGARGSPRLRAELDVDRVVFATWVDANEADAAKAVIRLAVRRASEHVAAQAELVQAYTANLDTNARNFALLALQKAGKHSPLRNVRIVAEREH